jgi:outer membrane lipoprotein SlyB
VGINAGLAAPNLERHSFFELVLRGLKYDTTRDARGPSRLDFFYGGFMRKVVLSLIVVSCSACASMTTPKTPDLYPNAKLSQTPGGQVQADVNTCLALGDEYVKQPNKYGDVAKQGVIGGAVGAGTGALAGTITGNNVGRATGAGAAVGGVIGVLKGMSEMNERSPSYERFVEHCLQKKGYEIVGWSSKG